MKTESDKIYEKIEAWLDGDLPSDESIAFSKEIEENQDLSFRVEQHRKARQVIQKWTADDYKDQISNWSKEIDEPVPENKKRKILWICVGAFLVILTIFVWYINRSEIESPSPNKELEPIENQEPSQEETSPIAQDTLPNSSEPSEPSVPAKNDTEPNKQTPIDDPPETQNKLMVRSNEVIEELGTEIKESSISRGADDYFNLGKNAFLNDSLLVAKELLEKVLEQNNRDRNYTRSLEILAFISFKEGDHKKAIEYFEQFSSRNKNHLTNWRLVHFYLLDYENQKDKFWKSLNRILDNPGNPHHGPAKSLNELLNESGIENQ